MKTFYTEKKCFPQLVSNGVACNGLASGEGSSEESHIDQMLDETRAKQTMQQAVIFWTFFSLAVMVSLYYNWLLRIFFLVQIILLILLGRYGFDIYQVDYYNNYFNPRLNNAHAQPDIS